MTSENIDNISWDILDKLFNKSGSSESCNHLVKHQIESYNKFLDTTLSHIITGFNPIKINSNNSKMDSSLQNYKINLNVINPSLTKPSYHLSDGTLTIMSPHVARMNNLTYSSNLYVDVHLVIENVNSDMVIEKFDKTVKNVYIGKIPIMVRSKACLLQQIPGIGEENNNECKYDYGGYFIVNGNEKVLVSQDRINENKTLVFPPNNNADGIYAEIRSMSDNNYLPPKTTSLNMTGKINHMGRIIRLNTSFIKSEIPVFIMFRILGVNSDKDIIKHIVYDIDDVNNKKIMDELMACCEDACDIHTKDQAEAVMIKVMSGNNKQNYSESLELLHNYIVNDFLPHTGKSYKRKAIYLGYMIRKIIKIHLKLDNYDNRDSYMNKRIDSPGILMSNLFRQCYSKMTKEIKALIERELGLWRVNNNISTQDIISNANIHRYFKQSLLDSWLRYSLSTGNWGIKSIGTFQNIKQGVSQVLNRMSYASTLSHLRRINTSMEKNGKLVQPRKLDNSQFGLICPAETPEGASVGLVKNMALTTNISLLMNSKFIRELLLTDLNVSVIDETSTNYDYLKNIGNKDNVIVQINGDIIGYHKDPLTLYNKLKNFKRSGIIYPMTSIIWNIKESIIQISTEAGRMFRPLLIVDVNKETGEKELRIIKLLKSLNLTWKEFSENKHFDSFISPCAGYNIDKNNINNNYEEGFIEYLDSDELNNSMIAINHQELYKGIKGTSCPPLYTHCEIHPSVMNGILGVNIPFSDHNQSPRNCYQCLNQNETVLMSNGTYKKIKDIIIGDKVICFNPETKIYEHTKVINHYNRVTNKIVYNINLVSGRVITATNDHKFITDKGWCEVINFDSNTKLGIYTKSKTNVCFDLDENNFKILDYGDKTLYSNDENILVIARLCGYYYVNELIFTNEIDKNNYIKDVEFIGFKKYNILDVNFVILMKKLCNDITWLIKCNNRVKKEFLSSYLCVESRLNEPINTFKYNIYEPDVIIEYLSQKNKDEYYFKYDFNDNETLDYYMKEYSISYNYKLLNKLFIVNEYNSYRKFVNKFNNYRIFKSYKDFDEWDQDVYIEGDICFIPFNSKLVNKNNKISDITVESDNHSFIGGNGFAVSNCAMGKQALGIYMSNFNNRIDTMGNILNYSQKPLVYTKLSKYTHSNELPSGTNAIVAIMTHTGFNQEDSVMINKSSLDRGLFTSTYYKAFRDQCTKNHSTGE
jgi:DNA-directed RNA polymerase beta subunit